MAVYWVPGRAGGEIRGLSWCVAVRPFFLFCFCCRVLSLLSLRLRLCTRAPAMCHTVDVKVPSERLLFARAQGERWFFSIFLLRAIMIAYGCASWASGCALPELNNHETLLVTQTPPGHTTAAVSSWGRLSSTGPFIPGASARSPYKVTSCFARPSACHEKTFPKSWRPRRTRFRIPY